MSIKGDYTDLPADSQPITVPQQPVFIWPHTIESMRVSDDPWMTLDEAAKYLRLPANYLKRLILNRELPSRKIPIDRQRREFRVKRSALDALDPSEVKPAYPGQHDQI